jgi:hypothetical protein
MELVATMRSSIPMCMTVLVAAALGCNGPGHDALPRSNEMGAFSGADGGPDAAYAVTVSAVEGAVAPCQAGFAHPNVCCKAGSCLERSNAPFGLCDGDSLTFPDRARCCPLDGTGSCVAAAPADVDAGVLLQACALPCGPEGHSPNGSSFPACGNTSSTIPCEFCCSGSGCASNVCNCPASGPCACNTPVCGACPDGWQAVAPQVDLCCRGDGSGARQCFSQSVAVSFVEGFASLSGPAGCDTYQAMAGHVREISCDAAKPPKCTCSVDGVSSPAAASSCDLASCN